MIQAARWAQQQRKECDVRKKGQRLSQTGRCPGDGVSVSPPAGGAEGQTMDGVGGENRSEPEVGSEHRKTDPFVSS